MDKAVRERRRQSEDKSRVCNVRCAKIDTSHKKVRRCLARAKGASVENCHLLDTNLFYKNTRFYDFTVLNVPHQPGEGVAVATLVSNGHPLVCNGRRGPHVRSPGMILREAKAPRKNICTPPHRKVGK